MSLSNTDIREWLKERRHTRNIYGEKLDRNGYAKSILCDSECCFRCAKILPPEDMARHEVYAGSDRKTSKAMGFWVTLCPQCHDIYHDDDDEANDLKVKCQERFELEHTREEFMALIGRNYL